MGGESKVVLEGEKLEELAKKVGEIGEENLKKMAEGFKKKEGKSLSRISWIFFWTFNFIAVASRFYILGEPNFVAWDEAHFGKFAGFYIKNEFYFDVHPPGGKILLGLAGYLSGFDGQFKFDSGATYPGNVPYKGMRFFSAIFGALLVPITFLTLKRLRCSPFAAAVATSMIAFDFANIALSRLILLDSMLICFTALTFLSLVYFISHQKNPFSFWWFFWLFFTGVSIGLVTSVKLVGLFVTALVGFYTIYDLWELFGDLKMPKFTFVLHFLSRAFCLILIPIAIYIGFFFLHFSILTKSGPGDSTMTSVFQANLIGNEFGKHPTEIAYGSVVTLRNNGYGGGILHSHVQKYPKGSKQQQVTCYTHHDANNYWVISKTTREKEYPGVESLRDGDLIILRHNQTSSNLHSHYVEAPLSKGDNEASGYGNLEIGDANDFWRVEVVGGKSEDRKINNLVTKFRLHHVNTKCILSSSGKTLPEWGFKQHEVSCKKRDTSEANLIWNFESHVNPALPKNEKGIPKSSFLSDFIHLNFAMIQANNALIPDPTKEDPLSSRPMGWPFLNEGVRTTAWKDDARKIYLIGNPFVWWASTLSLALFVLFFLFHDFSQKRKCGILSDAEYSRFKMIGSLLIGGYLLHYFPFWIMDRVTYLHHYLPALYFAILNFGFMFDHLIPVQTNRKTGKLEPDLTLLITSFIVIFSFLGCFVYFFPLPYGYPGPVAEMEPLKWVSSWNIV